jgi:hypothetical protein
MDREVLEEDTHTIPTAWMSLNNVPKIGIY